MANNHLYTDFGVSHRASGTAKFGKLNVALHSELQLGGSILGCSKNVQLTETHINEGKQMIKSNRCRNNAINMSNETRKSKGMPWWSVLFLVVPLV